MRRNALEEDEDSMICPVRLLLVLAMRSGNVHGTTLQEVLTTAQSQKDHRIRWRNPELPIFAQRDNAKSALVNTKPAGYNHVRQMLRKATEIPGCSHLIRPHDLRGGAAMDLVTVADRLEGSVLPKVAAELNHSSHSQLTTRRYTRMHTPQDTWAVRASGISEDNQPFQEITFGVPAAGRPPAPKKAAREEVTRMITAECVRNGNDPSDRVSRQNASYRVKRSIGENAAPAQPKSPFQQATNVSASTGFSEADITAECKRLSRDPTDKGEIKKAKDRLAARNKKEKKSNVADTKSEQLEQDPDDDDDAVDWEQAIVPHDSPLHDLLLEVEYKRWGKSMVDSNKSSHKDVAQRSRLPELSALSSVQQDSTTELWIQAIKALAAECGELRKHIERTETAKDSMARKRKTLSSEATASKRQKASPVLDTQTSAESSNAGDPKVLLATPEADEQHIIDLIAAQEGDEEHAELAQIMDAGLPDLILDDSVPPNDPEALKALTSDHFVDHYARINVICLSRKVPSDKAGPAAWRTAQQQSLDSASSVQEAIQFVRHCSFTSNGCTYTTPDGQHITEHENKCIFRNKIFDMKSPFQWPKQCGVPGCTDDDSFSNRDALSRHNIDAHPAKGVLRPIGGNLRCPVEDCAEERTCNSFLRAHLRESHRLAKDRVDELCPVLIAGHQQCLFPGCGDDEFRDRKRYFDHLSEHGVTDVQDKKEYTRDRVLGLTAPTFVSRADEVME